MLCWYKQFACIQTTNFSKVNRFLKSFETKQTYETAFLYFATYRFLYFFTLPCSLALTINL